MEKHLTEEAINCAKRQMATVEFEINCNKQTLKKNCVIREIVALKDFARQTIMTMTKTGPVHIIDTWF